jgi:hypothetical protein
MSLRSTKDVLKPKEDSVDAAGESSPNPSASSSASKDDTITRTATKPALEKSFSTKKIADAPLQPAGNGASSPREADSVSQTGPSLSGSETPSDLDSDRSASSSMAEKPAPVEAAGEGFYRALIRYKNGDIALKIPDHALLKSLKKHSSPSAKDLMEALKEHVGSLTDIPFDFVAVHFKESSIPHQAIKDMEARLMPKGYKFGVMYSKQGQTTDDEILSNNESSAAFEMFLKILGDRVDLRGFEGYNGGLDVRHGSTGAHSVYTKFKEHEVMFHVATLLPYVEGDQQQLEKKRHIGNDVVVIVFQDGDTPFQPDLIKSFFNHVFVVVRPIKPATAAATAKVSPFGMLRSRAGSTGGSALPLVRRPSTKDLEKDSVTIKNADSPTTPKETASVPSTPEGTDQEPRPSAPAAVSDAATSQDDHPHVKEDTKRLRRTKSQGIDKSVIRRAVIMAPSLVSRPALQAGASSASDKDKKMERQMSKEKLMKKQISREQMKRDPSVDSVHSSSSSRRASLEDSNESAPENADVLLPPKKKDKDAKSKPKDKKDRDHKDKDRREKDKDAKDAKDKDKDKDKDKRLRATKRLSASKAKSMSQKDLRLFEKRKHQFEIPSSSVPASMSPLAFTTSGSDYSDNDPDFADSEENQLPLSISAPSPAPAPSGPPKSRKINRKSSGKMTVTSAVASGSDNDSPNEHSKHKSKKRTSKRRTEGHMSSTSGSDTDPTAPASISSPRLPTITDDSDSEALLRPPVPERLSPRDSVSESPSDLIIPANSVPEIPGDDLAGTSRADSIEPKSPSAPEIVVHDADASAAEPQSVVVEAEVPTHVDTAVAPGQDSMVESTPVQPGLPIPEVPAPITSDSPSPREIDVSAALTLLQPIFPFEPVPLASAGSPKDGTDPVPPQGSSSGSDAAPSSPGETGDDSSSSRPNSARRDLTESKRGLLKKQSQFLVKQESNIKSFMRYRVEIVSKDGVVQSEQILPNPPVFHHGPYFKEFLLTKLINSERASYFAPQFAKPLERTRQILLENLFQEHAK